MARLTKDDLAQMDRDYLQSLDPERLLNAAWNLRQAAVEYLERLEQNSRNSSRPPSSDPPFERPGEAQDETDTTPPADNDSEPQQDPEDEAQERCESDDGTPPPGSEKPKGSGRRPGKQPGAKGFWRTDPLLPETTIPHYPQECAARAPGPSDLLRQAPLL
jgi:hypothetical protein